MGVEYMGRQFPNHTSALDWIDEKNKREHEAIESPQRLRRTISREEAEIIKRMVANLRYVDEWDDSMFFTAAQAFQAEAQKLRKRPIKGPRGNDRKGKE